MPSICVKCGRQYPTGADKIPPEENEFVTLKAEIGLYKEGGFKTKKTINETWEENDLCPECASALYEHLTKEAMKWLYPGR